jgi:hypothetical protein
MIDIVQPFIVMIIVTVAAGYLTRRVWRLFGGTADGCAACSRCAVQAAPTGTIGGAEQERPHTRRLPLVTLETCNRNATANRLEKQGT